MPRPSKRVAPDTLGGRIRAARQNLGLSLAEVAGDRYSTSLISQIERNRVDPSQESLHYLADKLKLPFEDLSALARQQRDSELEVQRYKVYEEQRLQAQQLLANNRPWEAIRQLEHINLAQLPVSIRWRLATLRGQAHFALRQFIAAQKDFLLAVAEKPESIPSDQSQEVMLLHLYLAASSRELGQLEVAIEQYTIALGMMNVGTSLRFIAEAHWGMAFALFELVKRKAAKRRDQRLDEQELQNALGHAENARTLYQAIGDALRAASLSCEIALIEQAAGNLRRARTLLQEVLEKWRPMLDEPVEQAPGGKRRRQERANVVSAAACYLAGIELEEHHYDAALAYAQEAKAAGEQSYIVRRAEAAITLGQILERRSLDPESGQECDSAAAEQAFRKAVAELEPTDRVAAKIRAHDLLGRHLLKKGQTEEGEKELDQARLLSHYIPHVGNAMVPESENSYSQE